MSKILMYALVGVPSIVLAILFTIAFTDPLITSKGIYTGAIITLIISVMGDAFIIGYGNEFLVDRNTYSKEETFKYDEKKIVQACGLIMNVGGIIFFIAFMGKNWFSNAFYLFIGLMLIWYFVAIVYITISERFLSEKGKEEKRKRLNEDK